MGTSVPVTGSLTIPMVPPVYIISIETLFSILLNFKQFFCIGSRSVGNFCGTYSQQLRKLIDDQCQVTALIPFPAVRYRGQIGCVGLKYDIIYTGLYCGFAKTAVPEGDHTADTYQESHPKPVLLPCISGEGMKNTCDTTGAECL